MWLKTGKGILHLISRQKMRWVDEGRIGQLNVENTAAVNTT